MLLAGDEVLALWREAGEWWRGESPREYRRFVDHLGIRREELTNLSQREGSLGTVENQVARVLRSRDDKVEHMTRPKPMPKTGTFRGKQKPCALLHLNSGYAYGRSTLFAETIPMIPECQEYSAVLLADPFSLSGALEFGGSKAGSRLRPLIGSTFEMEDGGELVLVAKTQKGYRSLSRLITDCHMGEPRLFPLCNWARLEKHCEDLLCLTGGDSGPINRHLVRAQPDEAGRYLDRLIGIYGREDVFVQIERCFLPWEMVVNRQLLAMAEQMKVVAVAGGPITHRQPEHFPAQDMLVCVETLCGIDEVVGRKPTRGDGQPAYRATPKRALNGERYVRSPIEFAALFADRHDLVLNTMRVAERCEEKVLPNPTQLPQFCADEEALLWKLVWEHPVNANPTSARKKRIEKELVQLNKRGFAPHMLIAWDMCRWAKTQNMIFSGRGSVVDSAVAFCLGISRIDAFAHDLHFERFMPSDGSKRPDIDIDFEAHRRDDVRNYLAAKYGDAHVATVGAFGTYGTRGIIREVGKVMGIPEENISYLNKRLHGSVTPERLEEAIESKPELRDSNIPRERFHWVFRLAEVLMELPRNLRSHSSGVVISREPIVDTVPVVHSGAEGVKIIQWDKRTTKHFFDKFDVLCLRGNDVLSDTQERVRQTSAEFSVEDLELEDEEAFRAMRSGQLIGVPQSASPAMRQAHIRLRTKNLKDASIVQAAIRPGVGGAVNLNLLIKRRLGLIPEEYIHPELERILKPTWGVIVFQEQVDQLLTTFGTYTSGEAEDIREAIYKRRREEHVESIKAQIISNITANGYTEEIAEVVYGLVSLFQGYGFAEGHALAFADISIRSIHCQQNYPAEYFSALFDSQPAGYYGPCTLANEARSRGVKMLPPSVNKSLLKFRVENVRSDIEPTIELPNAGVRVSLPQIGGLSKEAQETIVRERDKAAFSSFFDFVARVRPQRDELELLILCGALDELHANRRTMLWAIPSAISYAQNLAKMRAEHLSLVIPEPELPTGLADFSIQEKAIYERRILDLDIDFHLMKFERERVKAKGIVTAMEASSLPNKTKAFVVGNPIRLRFPPTASGKRVLFFDLEDETGLLNVTCFNETYLRDGHKVICHPYVTIHGEAQERDGHIAFLATRIYAYHPLLEQHLNSESPLPITTADFLVS